MFTRQSVLSLLSVAVLSAAAAPTFANELGFQGYPTVSTKSVAEVRSELAQFQANPITSDGYRYVGGDLGFVSVYTPSNSARPAVMASAAEAKTLRDLYIGG